MKITLIESNTRTFIANIIRISTLAILMILIVIIVALTGGLPNAYINLVYIPIFLSAYYWGILGGVINATVSGILASPLLSLFIAALNNSREDYWVTRLVIYILVGFIAGYLFQRVDILNEETNKNFITSPLTGAYNILKLVNDLEEKIDNKKSFAITSIKLINLEEVSKYIGDTEAKGFLKAFIQELKITYDQTPVYTLGYDEINLIFPKNWCDFDSLKRLVEKYSTSFKSGGSSYKILMKIGFYEYHGTDESAIEVYNKARIAYEQGNNNETNIYFYDKGFNLSRQELLEISSSLLESIVNKELYLVYQPKINLADNKISGVEVLTRWDRKEKSPVSPNVFIRLAEETGFIKEITTFVLENSYHQLLDWKSKDIELDFSINFTANELLDNHFAEWESRITECEHNITSRLTIEITERAIWQNTDKIIEKIKELRAKGIKISIDDYGTGFNTLLMAAKFPNDQIKIDKYFIEHIDNPEIRLMIIEMIDHAHLFGREVVAEGVETKEQLEILKALNCDIVQGYYFSRPVNHCELEKYYYDFT